MGAGTVIGTAGTKDKLDLVRRLGSDVAINHGEKDWIERVKEATGGRGTDIILEMVGGRLNSASNAWRPLVAWSSMEESAERSPTLPICSYSTKIRPSWATGSLDG